MRVTDQGGKQNGQKPAKKKKSQTHSSQIFTQTENTGSRLMVSTPWEHTAIRAGELQPSYKVSQQTDCSQLRENTTGAPSRFWLPVTRITWEISDLSVTDDNMSTLCLQLPLTSFQPFDHLVSSPFTHSTKKKYSYIIKKFRLCTQRECMRISWTPTSNMLFYL